VVPVSRRRGGLRRWLVAGNLALLLAMVPAIGRSQQRRNPHKIEGMEQPEPEPADDDDDAAEAVAVAAGCCAGFAAGMAASGANDANDANDGEVRSPPRNDYGENLPGGPVTPVAFDGAAAKLALQDAVAEARGCGAAEPPGRIRATVVFETTGSVRSVRFEPPFAVGDLAECVRSTFLAAEVPPFEGGDVTAHKSFTLQ